MSSFIVAAFLLLVDPVDPLLTPGGRMYTVFILSTFERGLCNSEGRYFWRQIILEGKTLIKRFELQGKVKKNFEKDS